MKNHQIKSILFRLLRYLPFPRKLISFFYFLVLSKKGEGFADFRYNGELVFLKSQALQDKTIFDVGAHQGDWTREALKHFPAAQIHCFEPLPINYQKLIQQPFAPKIKAKQIALSEQTGEALFYASSMSFYQRAASSSAIPLPCQSLDDYCEESSISEIDLLKLDVEGHELSVFKGAKQLLAQGNIHRIQFEYGPFNIYSRALFKDLFSYLTAYDYDIYQIMPRGLKPIPDYDVVYENFLYKNFVAFHKGLEIERFV